MKGQMTLGKFSALALGFVILAVILGVTGTILSGVREQQCSVYNETTGDCTAAGTTVASNASTEGLTGIDTMADWLPTIAVVVAAAVVIGVIINYFRD